MHDPAPAGLTLLRVTAGSATLDCTASPIGRARPPTYPSVACNVGGELQAQLNDSDSNPTALAAHLPRAVDAGDRHQHGEREPARAAARRRRRRPRRRRRRADADRAQERPARRRAAATAVRWTLTVTNGGPFALDSFTVDDAIPAGATLHRRRRRRRHLHRRRSRHAAARPPTARTASFAGSDADGERQVLASMAAYSFSIDARRRRGSRRRHRPSSTSRARTPLGGAPVSSAPA